MDRHQTNRDRHHRLSIDGPMRLHGRASSVNADADFAPCADGRRTVADRAVTIAAWIPEAAADSPASS
jgi:hypothetical protein